MRDTGEVRGDVTAAWVEVLSGLGEKGPACIRLWTGREIWVLTLTDTATSPAADKPANWVDGNIHAAELTASTACLYWLHQLVAGHGTDAQITQLLDTRVVTFGEVAAGQTRGVTKRQYWIRENDRWTIFFEGNIG